MDKEKFRRDIIFLKNVKRRKQINEERMKNHDIDGFHMNMVAKSKKKEHLPYKIY